MLVILSEWRGWRGSWRHASQAGWQGCFFFLLEWNGIFQRTRRNWRFGGLGWVGSWLALEPGSHGQCVLPSLARLGPTPAVWSHSPPDC